MPQMRISRGLVAFILFGALLVPGVSEASSAPERGRVASSGHAELRRASRSVVEAITPTGSAAAQEQTCIEIANKRCPSWAFATAGSTSGDAFNSSVASSDGTVVFSSGVDGTRAQALTVATDAATGAELWSVADPDLDVAYATAASSDGSLVFVTGQFCVMSSCDIATVAYDAATGERLWLTQGSGVSRAPYGGPRDMIVSPDGATVFVTGFAQFQGDETIPNICNTCVAYYVTIAYDTSDGSVRWVQTYRGPLRSDQQNFAQPWGIGVSPDGTKVYVTGPAGAAESDVPLRSTYGVTLAYDAVTGDRLWISKYSGDFVNVPRDLAVSADGERVYIGGFDRHFEKTPCTNLAICTTDSFFTAAIDSSTGEQLWATRWVAMGDAISLDIAPSSDRVFLAGYTTDQEATRFGVGVIASEGATGERAWLWHDDPQVEGGLVNKVRVSPDEQRVYVAGIGTPASYGNLGLGFAMRALGFDTSDGSLDWEGRYPGSPGTTFTQAFDVVTLPGQRVVLSGVSLTDGVESLQHALTVGWTAGATEMVYAI
ncbi:MAG: Lactonase, 7-bladed beta-propeller [Actinomycetota bacterium]|jgi:DNA-binding beta-propeller fold protein YncE|nr:Lactonase, 7-bladed beta-propeller [Actinomycetota bacterium]